MEERGYLPSWMPNAESMRAGRCLTPGLTGPKVAARLEERGD
jgi:hypothetical protein